MKINKEDTRNGELVGLLSSLRFYASIYEPKTSLLLRQAANEIEKLVDEVQRRGKRLQYAKAARRVEQDLRRELVLNRHACSFPYEAHLDIRVDGNDVNDAADSIAEYVTDHAEEVLTPMYPDKMTYPECR